MIVKLLVLLALALSLGELRDATAVSDEVTLLEFETDASDLVVVGVVSRSLPSEAGVLPEVIVVAPRSRAAGRVFRPPEVIAV